MGSWKRKIRGVLGTGVVWGSLGGVIGVVTGVVGGMIDPATIGEWVLSVGLGFAGFGFLAGTGFAATLSLLDGRRTLSELSMGRAAAWGGIAGFVLPLAVVIPLSGGALPILPALASAAVFGGVTAVLGAGTVRVARGRLASHSDGSLPAPSVSDGPGAVVPPSGEVPGGSLPG